MAVACGHSRRIDLNTGAATDLNTGAATDLNTGAATDLNTGCCNRYPAHREDKLCQ